MKVLLISRRFYPNIKGGGEISAFYIAKALSAYHDVHVCTFSTTNNEEYNIDNINVHKIKIRFIRKLSRISNTDYLYYQIAKHSKKIVKKIKPDIIHLLNFESIPVTARVIKNIHDAKIVATVNGTMFGCYTQIGQDYNDNTCLNCKLLKRSKCCTHKWGIFRGGIFYLYSMWYMQLLRYSYHSIDKFFPVSNAMIPLIKNLGVPDSKITVVYNPIQLSKLNKNYKRENQIIYAGRISKTKGLEIAIKAMQYVNAQLIIIGKKENYYHTLKEIVKKYDLDSKVKFLGYMDNKELHNYYKKSKVGILLSQYYEPLSRFLLEANSFGVPCIVSQKGGNNEIIQHGTNGYILSTKDPKEIAKKINDILNNDKFFNRMSKKAYETVQSRFAINNIGKKLNDEYEKLM